MDFKISFGFLAGFIMSAVYIACGIYLLITDRVFYFTSLQQNGLGVVLLTYGLFRNYNTMLKYKRRKEDNE